MEIRKKIILVDDHVIIRNGLTALIAKLGPYKVSQEFNSGQELLAALPFKTEPDLLILDISMPGMSGDLVMEELKKQGSKIPVLILTLNRDEEVIIKLFRSGVRGYLQKNCSADVFRTALEEIFRSGYYHNEFLTFSLQNQNTKKPKTEQELIFEQLTAREREFLKLVCNDKEYTYEQIADKMNVAHRTVDGYREDLFHKFGIKSKTGLVLFVLKHDLFALL